MVVEDRRHRSRAEAGRHLQQVLASAVSNSDLRATVMVAQLGGFGVRLGVQGDGQDARLTLEGIGDEVGGAVAELLRADPAGLVRRLEHRLQGIDAALAEAADDHRSATDEAERARARLGATFPYDDALQHARRRQQEINESLLRPEEGWVASSTVAQVSHGSHAASMAKGRLHRR